MRCFSETSCGLHPDVLSPEIFVKTVSAEATPHRWCSELLKAGALLRLIANEQQAA